MSGTRRGPPQHLSRAFRWLFPGAMGAEACDEMEREYAIIRERHAGVVACLWHLGHPCSAKTSSA